MENNPSEINKDREWKVRSIYIPATQFCMPRKVGFLEGIFWKLFMRPKKIGKEYPLFNRGLRKYFKKVANEKYFRK